jgi:outer membrane lipoprotein SlyB
MRFRIDVAGVAVVAALAIAGPARAQPPADGCDACGVVTGIAVSTERQQWTPLGTTGVQTVTPSGRMTDATTQFSIGPQLKNQGLVIVGAAGGAAYAKRPNAYEKPRWDVTIKMDRGGTRVIPQSYEPMLREGDRVRVLGTQLDLVNP